jgi:D-tyrosyl-tRNA(Tyr) deacylase
MRCVIQRVSSASVLINEKLNGNINKGFLVLLGIENEDNYDDVNWLSKKIVGLRIFSDENGFMNLSLNDIKGDILLVSQFTLFASTKKGNRPSFIKSARPEKARSLYEKMVLELESQLFKKIQTGIFGANMQINLVNDGPVTILIDSKQKD